MAENRQYDHEYKVQAVKLAKEIEQAKVAKELGIPQNTMYGWVRANRLGNLDLGARLQMPQSAMTLNEELIQLRQQVKELEKGECNDTYGRIRMYQAVILKQPESQMIS